ncbi:hypothetical protein J7337_006510 [Fusarium musae]|uniref:Uncharacterized protein n=1 Tax=Fusarium musae TaxID=1042133 RepID=A0A9P8DF66_9HYPO|nr:hypothetical protein J7337_006510 [Fusarium musae]KAG9500829.1 hypothetical protein J7337_006510 [Fusarium musae]
MADMVGKEQYEEARKNWLDTAKAAQQAKNEAKKKYNEARPGTTYVEWLLRQVQYHHKPMSNLRSPLQIESRIHQGLP